MKLVDKPQDVIETLDTVELLATTKEITTQLERIERH
jgi:hypothetical protein